MVAATKKKTVKAKAKAKPRKKTATRKKTAKKNLGGRPTLYNDELIDYICGEIMIGRSLVKICKEEKTPSLATVFRWLSEKPEFVEKYDKAKEIQADYLAEELIGLADDAIDVQKARLQCDVRKWSASKLRPKKYGDKTETDVRVSNVDMTPEEKAEWLSKFGEGVI